MHFSFADIQQFSFFDKAFVAQDPALEPFWPAFPSPLANFGEIILERRFPAESRAALAEVLAEQHESIAHLLPPETARLQSANIRALREPNTFAVTCAHQPCLFFGPLFFVYKILSTIKLAQTLEKNYPDFRFVPIYWNGGEDHDFAEVNHCYLFGKKILWADEQGGPVARYTTEGLAPLLEEIEVILGTAGPAREAMELLRAAYEGAADYGAFCNRLVSLFFGRFGLLTLDPMHPRLKALARGLFAEELFSRPSQAIVQETQSRLEAAGFKPQATARELNLFYLGPDLRRRDRLVPEGDGFGVNQTEQRFSREEMARELEAHPERFSPNVILRPIYQETILPSVAFVGGGGEVAYWLERKALFAHFGVQMPMVLRRDSFLLLDENVLKRWEKLGFGPDDFFRSEKSLVERFLAGQSAGNFGLDAERESFGLLFAQISAKAQAVDASLIGAVEAERAKLLKAVEQLEGRFLRAEKQRHETALGQLRALLEKIFPGGNLQERHDNFLPFFLKKGHGLFDEILAACAPWEPKMRMID